MAMIYRGVFFIILLNPYFVSCFDFEGLIYQTASQIGQSFTNQWNRLQDKIINHFKQFGSDVQNYMVKKVLSLAQDPPTITSPRPETEQSNSSFIEHSIRKATDTRGMTAPQIVTFHGYRVETHTVLTKDGYILTLHRIVGSKKKGPIKINENVLLHHGLLGSSEDWILLGPDKALPYLLSDAGCDVWMTNARGNDYSRANTARNVDSRDFWRFSFHEMGDIDLPSITDHILKTTNQKPINFIGHSMGTSAFLVFLARHPEYNVNFRIAILLAPLAFMSGVTGPLKAISQLSSSELNEALAFFGRNEFLPKREVPSWMAQRYCKGEQRFCLNPLYFLTGKAPKNITDSSFISQVLNHVPAGGSTDTILHYCKIIGSGLFETFHDEGDNSQYDLSLISMPVILMTSTDDTLSTVRDTFRLYFSLSRPVDHHVISGKDIHHLDFAFSHNAPTLVYKKVLEYLDSEIDYDNATVNEVNFDNWKVRVS